MGQQVRDELLRDRPVERDVCYSAAASCSGRMWETGDLDFYVNSLFKNVDRLTVNSQLHFRSQ